MASLFTKMRKEAKDMFCRKVKAFFKTGIENVVAFCKKHKSTIARLAGKFVIYVCKTVIEYLLDNYS